MTVYEVTGHMVYRGHKPGERFEAILDHHVEQRALRRGNVRIIERTVTKLVPGSYTLPRWERG